MNHRFYVISERYGLAGVADTQERAEEIALIAAVNTARTVYLHDRTTESAQVGGEPKERSQ